MLKRNFDPKAPHVAVEYLRMSSDMQNARSPQQQAREIRLTIKRTGYPFNIVKTYQDQGKSGRYLSKRLGYQQMMQDITSGAVQADLILVDTAERFGRVDDVASIRQELFENYGVLVLTADSNFCDPLSPQGKALAMVESMRATEDGRIKAHQVLRGKRDAAVQKHWPGGPAPFGYKLKSVMKNVHGREEVDYCVLVPDERAAPVIQLMFQTALNRGWGATRLAKYLNDNPDVPDDYKPFRESTICRQLDNTIYYGELTWNQYCTGIVADIRVLERNDQSEWERVPDFCEAIVSKELWDSVQALREVRRARILAARKDQEAVKQIEPTAPGITLNYLLSGLVYCSQCGIRMVVSSSQEYVTKDGEVRKYPSYGCPAYRTGACSNGVRVSEPWLREQVAAVIRERLFPWR